MKNKKPTTIYIDKDIYLLFKSKVSVEGKTITKVINGLIREYLEREIENPDYNKPESEMTVTDSMSVNLNQKEEKSWIRKKLNL